MSLSDREMYARMQDGWRMGRPFTVCGNGSTLEATQNARRWLPEICAGYGIRSVVDAGAGDMAWIKRIVWDVDYLPCDLIPRHESVMQIDITSQIVPTADAILCRMVLNHLQERISQTVALLRRSGARYLIATQFDAGVNRTRQFQRLDLRPYFGEPLESVQDGMESGCTLALFSLL